MRLSGSLSGCTCVAYDCANDKRRPDHQRELECDPAHRLVLLKDAAWQAGLQVRQHPLSRAAQGRSGMCCSRTPAPSSSPHFILPPSRCALVAAPRHGRDHPCKMPRTAGAKRSRCAARLPIHLFTCLHFIAWCTSTKCESSHRICNPNANWLLLARQRCSAR